MTPYPLLSSPEPTQPTCSSPVCGKLKCIDRRSESKQFSYMVVESMICKELKESSDL